MDNVTEKTDVVRLGALSPINTESEACNWIVELVLQVEDLRHACDQEGLSVGEQRKWFLRWLLKRGESLGALYGLKRTGRLSDELFATMLQRVKCTAVPSVQMGVFPGGG